MKLAPARAAPKINPAGPPPLRSASTPSGPQLGVDKVVANLRKMGDRRPKKLESRTCSGT